MFRPRRLIVAGAAVAALEGLAGVVALIALGPVEIAFYPVACAVATATVTVLGAIAMARHDGRGGSGGAGEGGSPPPPWWPGFERDFWRHVRERERTLTEGRIRASSHARGPHEHLWQQSGQDVLGSLDVFADEVDRAARVAAP